MKQTKARRKISLRVPFKAGVWYTASSIITKGISLLSTPIFTRLMSGEEYAVYPLYLSWIGIISALGGAEAIGSAALVGMQKHADNRDTVIRSATVLSFGVLGILCILYFAFYDRISLLSGLSRHISVMLFLQAAFDGIVNATMLRWRYEYKYVPVFLINVISSVASTALGIALVEKTALRGEGRIVGLLIASALTVGMIVFRRQQSGAAVDVAIIKFIAKRALPLIPQGLSSALLAGADRIMILRYFGAQELAKYSVAHSIGVGITFASSAILLALRPWIFRRLEAGEEKRIREAADGCVPILCIAVLALTCVSPEAMRILAPKEYSEAAIVILPTALSVIPSFLCSITSAAIIYLGSGARTMIPVVSAALINIGLNAVLFTFLPYTSAAISSLLASCIGLALWSAVYRVKSRKALFSARRCTALFLATCIAGYGLVLAKSHTSLRIILLLLVITVPFPLYKKVLGIVKEPQGEPK